MGGPAWRRSNSKEKQEESGHYSRNRIGDRTGRKVDWSLDIETQESICCGLWRVQRTLDHQAGLHLCNEFWKKEHFDIRRDSCLVLSI